jgi:phosphatidylinositol alpha-1,6-mannosyltransferase
MRAPLLAAITLHPSGGGIAVVSNLVWQVLVRNWGTEARLATTFDHENRPATLPEKARFAIALGSAQLLHRTDWVLFSHLGLAQAQHFVPGKLRRPYAVMLHGVEAWADWSHYEKRAVMAADLRIASSHYTAKRVMDKHPDVGPLVTCPLALPAATRTATRDDDRNAANSPVSVGRHAVLIVGRMSQFERYKGHDQLIDAWPAVVSRVPDAQLLIVGDGDDASRLRDKAAQTPCGERIQFLGYVSDATLQAMYGQAALFALPSFGEGFGFVYLEAMMHRLPCIGSTHDAASGIIVDGETGRLIDQRDIGGLSEAITGLLIDESQRHKMGAAGYLRATTEFTFDRYSARLRALMESAEAERLPPAQ